jgi:putative mRNA 3-end processing factor
VHGALLRLCELYRELGVDLGEIEPATLEKGRSRDFAGSIVLGPPAAFAERWARRFADPVASFASGWMRIRQRARQGGVELPLIISDHADWDELCTTIREVGAEEIWVTHGREEALVRWCELNGLSAKPLHLMGYEEDAE